MIIRRVQMTDMGSHREPDGTVVEGFGGSTATDATAVFFTRMPSDGPSFFGRTIGINLQEPGRESLQILLVQHLPSSGRPLPGPRAGILIVLALDFRPVESGGLDQDSLALVPLSSPAVFHDNGENPGMFRRATSQGSVSAGQKNQASQSSAGETDGTTLFVDEKPTIPYWFTTFFALYLAKRKVRFRPIVSGFGLSIGWGWHHESMVQN